MRARISTMIFIVLLALVSPTSQRAEAAVASGVGVVQSNLLMDFDLANPSGLSGNTLTDLSGNGYNGTIYQSSGQPTLNTAQGNYLSFNGNAGYVDLPDIVSSTNWSGLSVSFYANMGTRSTVERIFDFGMGQANNNIWVGMGEGNNMAIEVWHDSSALGWCRSAVNSVGANEWAQWNVVLDGTNCIWYKNNVLSSTTAYTYLPWARTLTLNYIGDSNWSADPSFEGGIGELAIYKSALTSTELTQNYNAQSDIVAPTFTSSTTFSVNENQSSIATLSTDSTSTFTILSGIDSATFNLTSSGLLTFKSSPNYEAPTDGDLNNIYLVTVRALDSNGNASAQSISVTILNVAESASISSFSLNRDPSKGIPVTISILPSAGSTPGKLTFYMEGKRIAGCISLSYSGSGSANCTWKPTTIGYREISVTFKPNGSEYASATIKKSVLVLRRSAARGSIPFDNSNA